VTLQKFTLCVGKERYLFAVFDGHGGNQVAEYVRDNFITHLTQNANYKQEKYEEALKETFIKMDTLMRTPEGDKALQKYTASEGESEGFAGYSGMDSTENVAMCCGCTACMCLIVGNKVYCANAGDSRCVLSQAHEVVELSNDHKPSNEDEEARIKKAGGFVSFDRVNGNLNLSRALGDFTYKESKDLDIEEQMVIPVPEIRTADIDEKTDFLIIACDGIWDCMSNKKAIEFVQEKYDEFAELKKDEFKPSDITSAMFERNIAETTVGNVSETGKEGAG
jgi:serine/threonine protein phosphatase PrpC